MHLGSVQRLWYNNSVAAIAQLVERIHGKDEVSGSSPDRGSTSKRNAHFRERLFISSYTQLVPFQTRS